MTRARICIAEPYAAYRDSIAELPDRLPDHGITLHAGRNHIQTVAITSPGREPIEVAAKVFAVPARPNGFVYAHLRRSKARRSMLNAQRLLELGVLTPDPIACIEYHDSGCLRRSYYICRYWRHDYNLTSLLYRGDAHDSDTDTANLLDQLVRYTIVQHDHGVLHRDYNPGNILVRATATGYDFALVDLNRLHFTHLDMNDRISTLVRIATQADHLRTIGRQYATLYGADPDDFCDRLLQAHSRFVVLRNRIKRIKSLFK